ncbi:ABC transporter substrate-binding protein [bacterium]|nr:ABC transporter substrate-binding protein [bacterium]
MSLSKLIFITLIFLTNNLLFAETPIESLKKRDAEIRKIVQNKDSLNTSETDKLKKIVNDFYDFNELSKLSLGKYWEERTAKEKQDFTDTFKQLISNQSVKKLSIYKADKIDYKEPVVEGEKVTVVTLAYYKKSSTEIIYKMRKVNNQWKVFDTVIDEASTVDKYRDSFYKKIKKTSFTELLTKLKQNLDKDSEE